MADSEQHVDVHSTPQQMMYRRAPKVTPFLVAGAVLGIIAAFFWVAIQGGNEEFSTTQTLGFLAVLFAAVGAAIAALVWMLLDRRSKRHVETVYAQRTEDPALADVVVAEDDYQEWSRVQQVARSEEQRKEHLAAAKAQSKAQKRHRRK